MGLYENIKAAMNNSIPPAQKLNHELYNTGNVQNDSVKAFIEAKSKVAEAASEMDALKERERFYFTTANDTAKTTELREEMTTANNNAEKSVQNVNWNELSTDDYAAALNATCGVENKQGGLDERIRDKALVKLTLESMSKEDIIKTFDMFMRPSEQEKWLKGIASDERYQHYLPNDETLNAYVEDTKNAILNKDPRLNPTNAMNIDFALSDTLDEIHKQRARETANDYLESRDRTTNMKATTQQTTTKSGVLNKLKSRFTNSSNTPNPPGSDGMSL